MHYDPETFQRISNEKVYQRIKVYGMLYYKDPKSLERLYLPQKVEKIDEPEEKKFIN